MRAHPRHALLRHHAAITLLRHGAAEDVRDFFDSVLQLDPDDAFAQIIVSLLEAYDPWVRELVQSIASVGDHPPFVIAVPVWGQPFTDHFVRFCCASLLSPNNLPELAKRHSVHLVIFTSVEKKVGESLYLALKATIDGMIARRYGRIVNITSSAVKAPIDILGLSNGARSGLTGFVAGLARKVVREGVTINNLLPGQFDTDRLRVTYAGRAKAQGRTIDEVMAAGAAAVPAGRFGTPEEFGAVCAFLCSAQAGYIAGQNILVDGGNYPGTF